MTNAGLYNKQATALVQEIYRPLLRYYFACFALYYGLMLPSHFASYEGIAIVQMACLAGGAMLVGVVGAFLFSRSMPIQAAEALTLLLNVLVVANVVVALNLQFDSVKLVYFMILAMAFSLANVSVRQSLASIAIAAVALFSFIPRLDTKTFITFAFLSFGAALASLAVAFMMRRAITIIAGAKLEAEGKLEVARELEQTLRMQSLSDELTGLPNRRAFFQRLESAITEAQQGYEVWLLLLDLDGFKAVNDVHGHLTGDKLLKVVSQRLNALADYDMHITRMGGDEFNIILTSPVASDRARECCDLILRSLSKPYIIDDRHIRISVSIGLKELEPQDCAELQLMQADYALIVAKQRGKNRMVEFTPELADASDRRAAIEDALRHAELSKELHLMFQPQFDFSSSRIVAAEALARWDSPIVGSIPPEQFIRIAEESGLITGITMTVVEKAFKAASQWNGQLKLSINLSSSDLISDPNIDQIIDMSREFDIDPAMVEFEVTETAMMADFEKATANLRKLTDVGFTIALDDFGTGYSNFSYLRRLPISKLKVDRSFIDNPADPMTERMLASLAGMARLLGVHCLLEGVEDEIGLLMAKRVGAQSAQGFLFGAPMPSDKLITMLANTANDQGESEEAVAV